MATTPEMWQRIEAFALKLANEFGEADDSNALSWLDVIETRAIEISPAVAAELSKQKAANRHVDLSEEWPAATNTSPSSAPTKPPLKKRAAG